MKLKGLINEIDFSSQSAFDAYKDKHKMRDTTKVNVAGKETTVGAASKKSEPKKVEPKKGGEPKKDTPKQTSSAKHSPIKSDSAETRSIQTYSNARPQAIVDFVNKHKLDASALGNFLQKGSLSDRMDFITALVGEPGNRFEKKIIDKFGEKEGGNKGGFQTPKRPGKPEVNKKVKQAANDLGITPSDWATSEYKTKMMQAAVEALTDANFHQEARELVAKLEGKPEWVKRPEYGTKEYDKWVKSGVYDSKYYNADDNVRKLGIAASQESGWDGVDAIDSLAYTLRMAGFGKEADTIQSIFDDKPYMKNKND